MDQALLFTILAVFPFGQLLRHWPLDIVVALAALCGLWRYRQRTEIFKIFGGFIFAAGFSYLVSVFVLKSPALVTGGLYLLRLVVYWFFLDFCLNFVRRNPQLKPLIWRSLIAVSVAIAIFGWIQYFLWPDLTALKYLGWDDHLYRLVGTFLDPGLTSLFLALGAILTVGSGWILPVFLTVSLAFTYARAGYLAFLVAMAYLGRKNKKAFFLAFILGITIWLLPKPAGQGVNLSRTYSIAFRLENYKETLKIAAKSPLFGIGYNNICLYRGDPASHSCSGADSSPLLVLATTGSVGLLMFLSCIILFFKNLAKGPYEAGFIASVLALAVHSLFVNSLFYPFTMAFFGLLISLQKFKEKNKASG